MSIQDSCWHPKVENGKCERCGKEDLTESSQSIVPEPTPEIDDALGTPQEVVEKRKNRF